MKNLKTYEKILKEQLIPNLVGKDTINHQFREIFSIKRAALASSCHPTMKAI